MADEEKTIKIYKGKHKHEISTEELPLRNYSVPAN